MLQRHRGSNGWNAFSRVLLALDQPWLREKARSNQRAGGQNKGSSKLPEADRLDVRSEIAAAAGVSAGNVTKVKQLLTTAVPEVLQALRSGEIRIHRASQWSKLPRRQQAEMLSSYREEKGVKKIISGLLSRHSTKDLPTVPDPGSLLSRLSALSSTEPGSVSVVVIKHSGKTVYVTKELLQSLPPYQEVIPICSSESR
jgi:hypothetical protein